MGNTALKKHYATAEKTGVLNISHGKLDVFPEDLSKLKGNLRSLDISWNKFATLPITIGQFTQLKTLVLDSNKLAELPQELGQLIKLETLSANSNKLKNLPRTLSNCVNLKQVSLQQNQLDQFPIVLCQLKHLDFIDLTQNYITSIPPETATLHVTELILNQNRLNAISERIADAPRLKTLRIQENCLRIDAIPEEILTSSSVSTLTVEGNLFDMKQFAHLNGYDQYMERFTAVKKKLA